ncbi:MAG TPA: ABC transporter permease [Bryobacteraceae bacterium]
MFGDVRLGFRTLVKNPGFTAVAVAMLALGIGVNATVFTVADAVLFKGFPLVHGNDRLWYIGYKNSNCCVSYPDFLDWKAQSKSFDGMAIVHGVAKSLSDENGFTERHDVTEVSANTFQLVGQRPVLGRDFSPEDEAPGADPVAMLNYGFWERRFAKDPAIVGQTVRLNGLPTTIIGVMPPGFTFPQKLDLWVPLVQTPRVMERQNRDTWMVVARLAEGVSIANARAEMEIIGKRLASAYPLTNRELLPEIQSFTQFFIGSNGTLLYGTMWGAVGFVLLIACANLANLMLARAIGRSREISVRIALGAGRWRIIRQLLIESVILSGLGGFLGWWIAKVCVRAYALAMAAKSSWLILDYSMDASVLGYLIAISIGTGLLFGLAPALRLSRLDVNATLKDGGRSATSGGQGKRLSALLVTGEMALAVVLLAGAGVMIRSFLKIHNADMGVKTGSILIASLEAPPGTPVEARSAFFERVRARMAANPGVESVAITGILPTWGSGRFPYELADAPVDAEHRKKQPAITIGQGYFHTLGASVIAGRDFTDADGVSGVPVVLVNQRFAAMSWPGEDPLGKRLQFFGENIPHGWLTVAGVVSNIIQNDINRQEFGPVVYLPYAEKPESGMWILAHTSVPPDNLKNAFRRQLQELDPDQPVYGPFAMAERMEVFWDSRFYGFIFLIFAALALLLASIGLYAVIAQSVSQRTQEIGIRIAIGATGRDILNLVFAQGMLPLAIGLTIGLAASFAVNRLLQSMLVSVSPADPASLAAASGVLILAAMLGCWIPARRAMRVDPVDALRNE